MANVRKVSQSGSTESYRSKETLNWLLHLHYVRGEFDRLEQMTLCDHKPSDYALYLRGLVQLRQRSEVKAALRSFSTIQSTNEPLYSKAVARCLMLLGQQSQVVRLIRDCALKNNETDWQLWHLLGCELLHQFDLVGAREAFQHALQTSNQIEPFLALSQCHLLELDPKSAIFVLRRAVELCPDHTELTIRLGLLLYANGQKSKGGEKLMQLQHLSATRVGDLRLSLAVGGLLQEARNEPDQALFRYRLANCLDSTALWNNVALCLASKGRVVAAVSCLKRSVYLAPLNWSAHYNLALLHLQLRQFASAFQHLKSATALTEGQSAPVLSLLATCLEQLQDEVNSRSAHQTAAQCALINHNPLPPLNFAIYLYNWDSNRSRAQIVRLLQQFEQCWLKRGRNSNEFDQLMMNTATLLSTHLQLNNQMAWLKQPQQAVTVTSLPAPTAKSIDSPTL